jgi:CHAT domain-containing protein
MVLLPTSAALGFARATRRPRSDTLFAVTAADRERAAAAILQRARGRTLIVATPTRELEFVPLEAAVVACAHHGRHRDTLDAKRVDPARLASACAEAEVLHFAGHGEFDEASPYRAGVWIGPRDDPGAIWANADIFSDVQAPAGRLAVLSGCETGRTQPNLVGEEVSLPAAFIAAGYAAVLASRWAVDDLSTTLLMGEFHRRWISGRVSVAAALAASRRWLRDLSKAQALALIDALPAAIDSALPERSRRCRALCLRARRQLAQAHEQPFADPLHWAAFFVAGDGAVSADTPRIATSSALLV